MPLNIFRNGTLAPSCVSLIHFGFYTTVLFINTVETTLFLCVAHTTPKKGRDKRRGTIHFSMDLKFRSIELGLCVLDMQVRAVIRIQGRLKPAKCASWRPRGCDWKLRAGRVHSCWRRANPSLLPCGWTSRRCRFCAHGREAGPNRATRER